MLLSGLILAGVVVFFTTVFFVKKNTQATNRYKKTSARKGPTLGKNPLSDTDAVLGIKPEVQPQQHSVETPSEPVVEQSSEEAQKPAQPAQPVVLYLMAPKGACYAGYELLQTLLSTGLRFGDRHIFHRHEHKDGRGEVLFHCASAQKPGVFDFSNMGEFSTVGLCFFFEPKDSEQSLMTLDLMLDTIDQLVEDLGGDVCDMSRQPLTKESVLYLRQKLSVTSEQHATADLFV